MFELAFAERGGLRQILKISAFLLFSTILLSGCGLTYKTKQVLFKTPEKIKMDGLPIKRINTVSGGDSVEYKHRIKPDDLISIRLLNNFDITQGVAIVGGSSNSSEVSFLVDPEGYAHLPMVGRVLLSGMTRQEAARELEKLYSAHFKDPSLEVYIVNLDVTVLGAVSQQGNVEIVKERTTLTEVLAEAGGLSAQGRKDKVMIIRGYGKNKKPEIIVFDLTQIESIEPDDLIVHDKDIIYVEPRAIQALADNLSPYTNIFSVFTSSAALVFAVINTIAIAKSVK